MIDLQDSQPVMPTIRDIWSARSRLAGHALHTPLIKCPVLSAEFNAEIYLKMELYQQIGSFKIRGAANKILSLPIDKKRLGVATYSTGNHGLAVAYIAKQLGISAYVFVSARVPRVKIDALRSMGAIIEIHGTSQDEAGEYCYRLAAEKGLTVVEPFDDLHVIAGQGTIGLELLEDCPKLDSVIVPLSGGGLLSGIALALKSNDSGIKTIGVSMQEGAVMYHSIRQGKPVVLEEADTLADSLMGGIGEHNRYTLAMVRQYVDETVLVSEQAIAEGMAHLFKWHRLAAEGASATGIAAMREHKIIRPGSKTALIISGKNVDTMTFIQAVQKYL